MKSKRTPKLKRPGQFAGAHGSASCPPIKKPPLGLRPRWLAEEQRLVEVASAAARYLDAGKQVPASWVEEMVHFIGSMEQWRAWKQRGAMTPNAEVSDGGPLTHDSKQARTRRSLH
jgi:hypothetical protein